MAYPRARALCSFFGLLAAFVLLPFAAHSKRALDLDPASPAVSHSLAVQLYLARKFDRAIEQAYDTLEMDGNFAISYVVLGEVYVSKGMYRDGLSALEKYSALSRRNATWLAFSWILACSTRRTKGGVTHDRGA